MFKKLVLSFLSLITLACSSAIDKSESEDNFEPFTQHETYNLSACMEACSEAKCGFMIGGGCAHLCGMRFARTNEERVRAYENAINRYKEISSEGGCLEKRIQEMSVSVFRASGFSNVNENNACKEVSEKHKASCINDYHAYTQNKEKCESYSEFVEFGSCMEDFEYLWLSYKQHVYEDSSTIANAKEWKGYCLSTGGRRLQRCK